MLNRPFDQNRTNPDEQAFAKGASIDAGTLGLYPRSSTDPGSYRDKFVSQLRKNPPAKNFYQQVWSADSVQDVQKKIDGLNDQPNFFNPGDQAIAKDFLSKYTEGISRGLLPEDESVSQKTIASLQTQQPGQGVNNQEVTVADRLNYPGKSGIQTS